MKRKHQEYINRHLYEESLHRKHAAARENQAAMEHGDDDSQSDLTPTKEQMYLDIIKELERKLEDAEAMRQESASQHFDRDDVPLKTDGGVASEKMYTAVNYMLNFWRELINYTNEGHYTIDNSAAERSIRPLTVGRKNYIHFGSEKSAEVAAFFYSIMATCKVRGANARDYVAGFFKALNAGRTDYAQMLPGLL